MFRGSVKGTGYPLHSPVSPSLPLPCVTMRHHISTGVYFLTACKRTSPFKSAGASVQSTTGSWDVCIGGSNVGYTMFRGSVKGTGYPLHSPVSPSLPLRTSLCAITFQLESTSLLTVNGQVHLNRQGHQFSQLLAAEMCASAVVMPDTPCSEVVWRALVTCSIRQFPLHFPTRASLSAITFQLDSTTKSVQWMTCLYSMLHHNRLLRLV